MKSKAIHLINYQSILNFGGLFFRQMSDKFIYRDLIFSKERFFGRKLKSLIIGATMIVDLDF